MAEASKAILIPSFSHAPGSLFYKNPNHHYRLRIIFKRNSCSSLNICCSSSVSTANDTTRIQTIPWGCDTDSLANASALQQWLTSKGLPEQKMAIQKVDVGERGLVALKNIRKGEKLLFVPPSLFITADSEWTCSDAGEILGQYNVPDWPLLATYLISEASCGASSRWNNYISALPRQPYSLLYWTRSELDRYLEASQIRERATERINDVTGTYNDLRLRIFSQHPNLFPEEPEIFAAPAENNKYDDLRIDGPISNSS